MLGTLGGNGPARWLMCAFQRYTANLHRGQAMTLLTWPVGAGSDRSYDAKLGLLPEGTPRAADARIV